jgi:pimeloyl-ACP methyl ester carboxylesterase
MALDMNPSTFSRSPENYAADIESALHLKEPPWETPPITSCVGEVSVAGATAGFQLDIPDDPVDLTVNVIIYGFAGCDAAYRGLAQAMSQEQGLITLSCHLARLQHPRAALHPVHLKNPTALSSKIIRASIGKLPEYGLSDKVNLFGHSMGGWIGSELAAHKPQLVDKLVLFGSAGLIEHSPLSLAPGIPRLVGRIAFDLATKRPDAIQPRHAIDTLRHVLSNPLLTSGEALTVSRCDIRDTLRAISGPEVAVLHPTDDEFFDSATVEAEAVKITPHVKLLDGLGHGAPITHPSEVAAAYAEMLSSMRKASLATV